MQTHVPASTEQAKQQAKVAPQPAQLVGEQAVFEDNRPEAVAQLRLQTHAANSPQSTQLKSMQSLMNTSLQVQQMQAAQMRMMNGMGQGVQSIAGESAQHLPQENRPVLQQKQSSVRPIFQMKDVAPMKGVAQLKVDAAVHDYGETDGNMTPTKIIKPKLGGGKVFAYRFAKNGVYLDSFSKNIAKEQKAADGAVIPVGPNPVLTTVDIVDVEDSKEEIAGQSRIKHFRVADKQAGIKKTERTNRLTWHHKAKACELELVDMNVHGVMSHHGGFSAWKSEAVAESDADDD